MLARIDVRGLPDDLRAVLARPESAGPDLSVVVAAIVADVRVRGALAVRELTARLDGAEIEDPRVDPAEIAAALERISPGLRAALELARDQIVAWHEAQHEREARHVRLGVEVVEHVVAVDRAGCYVPGGRAPLASSVLMTALPARVAGVAEVVLCSPPDPSGRVDDAILAAAAIAQVDEVYAIGGAQAVAAMAYGAGALQPVDVIVGPVLGLREQVGRDPHRIDRVVRDDRHLGRAGQPVDTDGSEHLPLRFDHVRVAGPDDHVDRLQGAVFVGAHAPAVIGDYVAGTNHVLPTGGTARFASALRVADFQKHIHVVRADASALARVGPSARAIAEAEGLHAHADSVRMREEPTS